jgi:type II secretory pathway component PulL
MRNAFPQLNLEEQKLVIERDKLDLEREKTSLERKKAIWTAGSILVAAGTILLGIWSTYKQAESQFQVEVAKSIMQGTTDGDIVGRLLFYKRIFPEKVPPNFAVAPTEVNSQDSLTIAAKKEFWRTMVGADMSRSQALDLWIALFPGDDWAKSESVAAALRRAESQSTR